MRSIEVLGLRLGLSLVLAALLGGCRTPSGDILAGPGDFALLEIQLRG